MDMVHDDDDPVERYEDLPEPAQRLVDTFRHRQELIRDGLLDPEESMDDFRVTICD